MIAPHFPSPPSLLVLPNKCIPQLAPLLPLSLTIVLILLHSSKSNEPHFYGHCPSLRISQDFLILTPTTTTTPSSFPPFSSSLLSFTTLSLPPSFFPPSLHYPSLHLPRHCDVCSSPSGGPLPFNSFPLAPLLSPCLPPLSRFLLLIPL